MTKATILILVTALTCAMNPGRSFAQEHPVTDMGNMWRAEAARFPIGSIVRLRMRGGGTMTAVLLGVDESGITVKPKTRIAEPSRHISFDHIDRLERYAGRVSFGKYAAVEAGIGAGVFLVLVAVGGQ